MWAKHSFINNLYEETIKKHSTTYDTHWKENLIDQFRDSLGHFSSEEPLQAKVLEETKKNDYTRYSIEITTLPNLRMQMYVLIPNKKQGQPSPAVLALHGHGYGNKDIVGINPDGTEREDDPGYHKDFAIELVKKGLIVVAPELIGFGERRYTPGYTPEKVEDNSCYSIASQLLLFGKTIASLRIFECSRALDYLATRNDVDMEKIGCMGISGGGLVAAFTSVLDERIKAVVVSGYTSTFKESIMARRHCLDNYIPGILQYAEMPELIGLIAPRPLFVEAGIQDHLFPDHSVKQALEKIEEIYHAFNAEKEVISHFFDGGHEINGEKSYKWLLEQLN
ncbi:alpha/beta hydrolase family protein [Bacillus sp. FJAT-50079]|uniref:dienelactone hydrolase family protein n=1 Tax=Bacillus sp. FJAT-50079 TaxID=2833577 RepID=UPI001BC9369C|nr:alpha/beta hydrolase family protein [Bacillus sp. FJAT-50079]MBS4207848.1 dienelactone hydrolase family protein [Bacillus sp. FJAT-50079]